MGPPRSSGSDERQLLFVGEQLTASPRRLSPALFKAVVCLLASQLVVPTRDSKNHPPNKQQGAGWGRVVAPSWSQFRVPP